MVKEAYLYNEVSSPERERTDSIVVAKFGGTSMGTPEAIQRVSEIVKKHKEASPLVVVVSAVKGITNRLSELAGLEGFEEIDLAINAIADIHRDIVEGLGMGEEAVSENKRIIDSLRGSLYGELSPEKRDRVMSYGERLSASLFSKYLTQIGVPAIAINSSEFIEIDANFGNAHPILSSTQKKAEQLFSSVLKTGAIPVVTGFIGRTSDGRLSTFGRNTSDYSASFIGRAIGASEVYIWTDVDGMCTADPRIVPEARVIPEMTYEEAAEMSFNGASVIHPKTFEPLWGTDITLRIKNTFNPESGGTLIKS